MVEQYQRRHRAMAAWLFIVAAMVFVMVVLGGLTRLTHSGLSIVDWRPLTGWLPPLSETEWQRIFLEYQQFPEYRKVNAGMTLAGFKGIFWLEFIHRVWGRLIGVAFAVPFLVFLVRGWIDRSMAPRLIGLFILGGLQGVLGWFMVKSGLVDRPDVSQYRLVAHFGAALVIYGALIWVALDFLHLQRRARPSHGLGRFAVALAGLVFVTALWGGFVAGTDAGFAYNTFPTMDGEWIPQHLFAGDPAYLSPFEDITTVQFFHRVLAVTTFVGVFVFWAASMRVPLAARPRLALFLFAVAVSLQLALGIATLLLFVPVAIAAAHQAGAILLFTMALWVVFELRPSIS
ncbi:MAG: COX15/CtaA family protein [Rhodospirillales bacterium]|nr:COX15/CtaA family protein [Rhodospirillales bacterium]